MSQEFNPEGHMFKVSDDGSGFYQFGCIISNGKGEEVYRWVEGRYFDSRESAEEYWKDLKVKDSVLWELK